MGQRTDIGWCDSTQNGSMGCPGCELWNPPAGVRICYAGNMTERFAGQNGFPEAFDKPQLFPGRIAEAAKWRDLTGTARPDKPWLDGLPRTIFLDDMGDTLNEALPEDWLAAELPIMAAAPHVWILLTKRPTRMAAFFSRHRVPDNVWLLTSVTRASTWARVNVLRRIVGARMLGISLEPQLERIHGLDRPGALAGLGWLIVGGASSQSGQPTPAFDPAWARAAIAAARRDGVPCFVKQLGGNVRGLTLRKDATHGADWDEWPADLRVREMPAVKAHGRVVVEQLSLFSAA